jgi:hypothetical protein
MSVICQSIAETMICRVHEAYSISSHLCILAKPLARYRPTQEY